MAGLIDALKKQNFEDNDSLIASTAMHPIEAAKRLKSWLDLQMNTGMGVPQLDESTGFYRDPTDAQQHEAAFNIAGLLETGAIPFAPKSAGGTLGTFIGPTSKMWNKANADEAVKLLKQGADPAKVWKEKLVGLWPDGKPFSEIPDNEAVYRGLDGAYNAWAEDAYAHPDLYDNYPHIGNMLVRENDSKGGSFDPTAWEFMIGKNGTPDSTMPHEVQHAIQQREGWGLGGTPDNMDYDIYRRLFGEAQARATQDRLLMDMTQRRDNYPLANGLLSDIPIDDLIYKYSEQGKQSNGLLSSFNKK